MRYFGIIPLAAGAAFDDEFAAVRKQARADYMLMRFDKKTESNRQVRREKFPGTLINTDSPSLYLGSVADAMDPEWLKAHKIGAVLNMINMTPDYFDFVRSFFRSFSVDYRPMLSDLQQWYARILQREDFMYLNLPIEDGQSVDVTQEFPEAFEFIDSAIRKGVNILVHCHAGQNRSAAVVVGWLIWSLEDMSLQETIEYVDKYRHMNDWPDWHILTNRGFNSSLIRYCLSLGKPDKDCRLPKKHWRHL